MKRKQITVTTFRDAAYHAGMKPTTPSYQAAEAVICWGATQNQAAIRYGVTQQAVSQAVVRVREQADKCSCPYCGQELKH